MNLVIFNYSMSPNSLVFSHQREVAIKLSLHFEETTVITADGDIGATLPGIMIRSINWVQGRTLVNLYNLLRISTPLLLKKNTVVFSHMTEIQSLLIAPLCRIIGIKHFLWYAHKSKSPALYLAYPFLTGIVTSTRGSCPIRGKKVHYIGQGVQILSSRGTNSLPKVPPLRWYHVSRFDKSKRIERIIEAVNSVRGLGFPLTLDLYGEPSSREQESYKLEVQTNYKKCVEEGWLRFFGKVSRSDLAKITSEHDGFIHAFDGSLDKTVIEATLYKRLVATLNREYHETFSTDYSIGSKNLCLEKQLVSFLGMDQSMIELTILKRFQTALEFHEMTRWIVRLLGVINGKH